MSISIGSDENGFNEAERTSFIGLDPDEVKAMAHELAKLKKKKEAIQEKAKYNKRLRNAWLKAEQDKILKRIEAVIGRKPQIRSASVSGDNFDIDFVSPVDEASARFIQDIADQTGAFDVTFRVNEDNEPLLSATYKLGKPSHWVTIAMYALSASIGIIGGVVSIQMAIAWCRS